MPNYFYQNFTIREKTSSKSETKLDKGKSKCCGIFLNDSKNCDVKPIYDINKKAKAGMVQCAGSYPQFRLVAVQCLRFVIAAGMCYFNDIC